MQFVNCKGFVQLNDRQEPKSVLLLDENDNPRLIMLGNSGTIEIGFSKDGPTVNITTNVANRENPNEIIESTLRDITTQ